MKLAPAQMEIGRTYIVKHRNFDGTESNKTKRIFMGYEERLNLITCFVFSSRVMKNVVPKQEISIPHYDVINIW